jgi:uncharacterized damage-inducible protein DinB
MAHDVHAALPMLRAVYDRNLQVLTGCVDGVDEAASVRPLFEGGSHLHWLLAHLVASRDALLVRLDREPVWTDEARRTFGRGSTPAIDPTSALADHLERLTRQQARLDDALATLDGDALARPAGRMTVGGWIEFMAWHESYHVGQATLYRRGAGLPSTIG